MASRRPIYTFQLTGYDTEWKEKNIFAVLCEWLTPLTTRKNWYAFLFNISIVVIFTDTRACRCYIVLFLYVLCVTINVDLVE